MNWLIIVRSAVMMIFVALVAPPSFGQTTVFSDNFNRADSTTIGNSWVEVISAGDGNASIVSNELVLTNDGSGTANAAGRVYVTQATSGFASPYDTTLTSNVGLVRWSFNMQQIRTDPSGFDSGNYGVAFALAGSSSDLLAGNGYAVVLGQSGSTDNVRLVRYADGLDLNSNLTNLITGTDDFGTAHLSINVTYDPTTEIWNLLLRNDGTSFADPLSGVLTSQGTIADSTFTNVALGTLGALWNYSTAANQTAEFDNVTVQVTEPLVSVPAPAALPAGLALLGLAAMRRRR